MGLIFLWARPGATYTDVIAGTSSSVGTPNEVGGGADAGAGTSSSSGSLVELAVRVSTPVGVSSSTITGLETYVPAPSTPLPVGLMDLLYPPRKVPRRPQPEYFRVRRARLVYLDTPTGIAHSTHALVEEYVRGPVPLPPPPSEVSYEEVVELVAAGVL